MQHPLLDLTAPAAQGYYARKLVESVAMGLSARRPATKSSVTTPVACYSSKMQECFAFESPGESETMSFADMLEDVASLRPQPVEVRYLLSGNLRRAFPDLAVVMLDGSVELWEVKPERRDPELVVRLCALAVPLNAHGIRYRVRTPLWHRRKPHLTNVRSLVRHAGLPLCDDLDARIAEALPLGEFRTIGDLRSELRLELADVYAAVACGMLAADIGSCLLGDKTEVRRAKPGARSGAYIVNEEGKAASWRGNSIPPV